MARTDRFPSLDPQLAREIDQVCDRFEDALAAGKCPAIDEYLQRARGAGRGELLYELVRLDLDYRRRRGDDASPADYAARFPELGPLLPELFDAPPEQPGLMLEVVAGPYAGCSFRFDRHDTFVVGRSPTAHFSLPQKDRYFSRFHFLVEVNPPLCRLVDLNSHNGTMVNGVRVERAELKHGDEISAGTTSFRVRWQADAAACSLPAHGGGPGSDATADLPAPAAPVTRPGATTADLPRSEPPVPVLPGYDIVRELGRGGMGIVYEAVRTADKARVALKMVLPKLRPSPRDVQRFLREADILRALTHPHIVAFRDMGEHQGALYFAMDFVAGIDASRLLQEQGRLEVGRAVCLILQLLDALAFAHDKGFVHRDLKPANLLVAPGRQGELVYLADFGLARAWQNSPLSGLTMTGHLAGTPAYMPPEQVLDFRNVGPGADQYSAGATLYTLLAGRAIYEVRSSHPLAFFTQVLQEDPLPLLSRRPELPPTLAAVIHRALARETCQRYADVRAFAEALRPFAT